MVSKYCSNVLVLISYRLRFGGDGGASKDNSEDDVEFHRSSSSSSLLVVTIDFLNALDSFIFMRPFEEDFRPSDSLLFSPGMFLAPENRGFVIDGSCMLNSYQVQQID
jgi:hypothetical protein